MAQEATWYGFTTKFNPDKKKKKKHTEIKFL